MSTFYKCAKFQLPSSISFRDKESVPKFNVLLAPCSTPYTLKLLSVLQVLGKVKQPAKFQHRIFMHHAVMGICIYHRFPFVPKMVFWGHFEGEYVKMLCSDP